MNTFQRLGTPSDEEDSFVRLEKEVMQMETEQLRREFEVEREARRAIEVYGRTVLY